MADPVDIRCFESRDADAVVALWENVLPSSSPWNEPRSALLQKNSQFDRLFFVAERNDSIVGTVLAGYDGVRGWIYRLAVDPAMRRQGIGQKLLGHAEAALTEQGCKKVNLQVRADNDLNAFYGRCGFELEDRSSFGKVLTADVPKSSSPTLKVSR